MIFFSIIICTHNGSRKITETLNYLDALFLSNNFKYEVLLIDNASTDDVKIVYEQFLAQSIRAKYFNYYFQPKKGKDNALKLGIEKSNGNWIVICDDDNWLSNNYLLVASNLIEKNSDVVLWGAKSVPKFSQSAIVPSWFWENQLKFACGEQYPNSGFVSYRQVIWGAGIILLKEALSKALNISNLILTDKRGEDTEIFYRIIIMGYRAYYSNDLIFYHFMSEERMIYDKYIQMLKSDNESQIVHEKYKNFIKYYLLNKHKINSKVKWIFIGFFIKVWPHLIKKSKVYEVMLNLYSPFFKDTVYLQIKQFYSKSLFISK